VLAGGGRIFLVPNLRPGKLGRMRSVETRHSSTTGAASSFAGLLASMASASNSEPSWNDDGLAEDVATISYERALRKHGPARGEALVTGAWEGLPGSATAVEAGTSPAASGASPAQLPPRTASITIRLSGPECAQLRRRATEAGLTVSAYLRSCTLEVENLRTQVKQTLADLRSSTSDTPKVEKQSATGRSLTSVWRRLWPIARPPQPALGVNPANPFAPLHYSQS